MAPPADDARRFPKLPERRRELAGRGGVTPWLEARGDSRQKPAVFLAVAIPRDMFGGGPMRRPRGGRFDVGIAAAVIGTSAVRTTAADAGDRRIGLGLRHRPSESHGRDLQDRECDEDRENSRRQALDEGGSRAHHQRSCLRNTCIESTTGTTSHPPTMASPIMVAIGVEPVSLTKVAPAGPKR